MYVIVILQGKGAIKGLKKTDNLEPDIFAFVLNTWMIHKFYEDILMSTC